MDARYQRRSLSRREELNPRPTVYETVALPLSYAGIIMRIIALHLRGINRRENGWTWYRRRNRRDEGCCAW